MFKIFLFLETATSNTKIDSLSGQNSIIEKKSFLSEFKYYLSLIYLTIKSYGGGTPITVKRQTNKGIRND